MQYPGKRGGTLVPRSSMRQRCRSSFGVATVALTALLISSC